MSRLWGTTALAGVGMVPAQAGAVEAGGALNVDVSGFVRFLTTGGQLDNARLDRDISTGLDFSNDTELHILVRGRHADTGLEYGAHIEIEGDTDRLNNADETWLFLRGGWGEIRLGDDDGIADLDGMALSAASIAAGTGGLDGDVVGNFGGGVPTYEALGTSDATKIIYRLHPKAGLRLGLSYTPTLNRIGSGSDNGDSLALRSMEARDVVEAAVGYAARLDGLSAEATLSGLRGTYTAGHGSLWEAQAGFVLGLGRFRVAGSFLAEEAGPIKARAVTAGVAVDLKRADISLNYGQIVGSSGIRDHGYDLDKPWTVILSGDIGLAPGLVLGGDIAWFDNDVKGTVDSPGGDSGWQGVLRLGLAF